MTILSLDRVETAQGTLKIEAQACAEGLRVKRVWLMSSDGWEELIVPGDCIYHALTKSSDAIIRRFQEKYRDSAPDFVPKLIY